MKNVLIMIGATAVLIIGLVWLAGPPQDPASAANTGGSSKLEAAVKSYDFGTVSMKNGPVSYEFTFKNSSDAPVTITKIFTSCMCTKATLINSGKETGPFGMPGHVVIPTISETVTPGSEAMIRAVFDPAAHGPAGVGTINRVVTVQTDGGAPLEFRFRAVVTP